jgi:succinate dehydrogenase / fumarate reductase, membrane anchor subunit
MRWQATGLPAWWMQRLSAAYMLLFVVFALAAVMIHPPRSHGEWRSFVGHPAVAAAFLSFFAALLSHMWVGLRDVLIDYARPACLRRSLLAGVALALVGLALWVVWILLRTLA